ncbi:MOSC domain-containing protein [Curtobacterium flaccumfaciens]|uniref:MOSC domain-containing protein n=1 Tax=Curtobacterium flaccumfaciens TaxID=2035 RepID=UPI001599C634|nr:MULTISPECIES: MOSC domain-containing protein [Curtobacterium]MBT1585452.1 MOSC domain-containing protein [Curtobacterium flaccumfaciens pv. flaccumfaciens]MCE0457984.1 MOSC domain-containing protein [Curtobacterium allii]MCS5492336.1 MOSC domain-containing protein [Curtobacterium flaccumfaciens pv. flaccumfaciens]MCS5523325.1 MOSC domain-containing protein [Curtobacterium flaccumfaciens pv. oortii]MCX2798779.1 MOSC domain-containing protein [Curtobacterium flaccumfaciens pv. flaccumfaciens]
MSLVTAVCRVDRLLPDSGIIGVTAIDKRPVTGSVRVRPLGLRADVQANRKYHGGVDQAVYAYADEDAAYFADLLEREVPPGLFGENLRTSGIDVTGAVTGERWRIGDTLVLEVTVPRTPCGTFARRMGVDKWVKRFADEGRPGAYFRVVKSGSVAAGDPIEVTYRPDHGVTIGEIFGDLAPDRARAVLESGERLAPKVVQDLSKVAARV